MLAENFLPTTLSQHMTHAIPGHPSLSHSYGKDNNPPHHLGRGVGKPGFLNKPLGAIFELIFWVGTDVEATDPIKRTR